MKLPRMRDRRRHTNRTQVGLESMHGRLLLGLLVLALVPALVGVVFASVLVPGPDTSVASERARQTSTAAADMLIRAQGIESRMAALAADSSVAGLSASSGPAIQKLARRALSTLRGTDGSLVAGACVTRVSDGRMTLIAEDRDVVAANGSCAQGAVLRAASRTPAGTIIRALPDDSQALLLATPIAGRGSSAVLSAVVDLERLIKLARSAAATSIVIDTKSADLVVGATRTRRDDAERAPIPAANLAMYADGIMAGQPDADEMLLSAGWTTTMADLWPTRSGASLGLIQAWPAPEDESAGATWLAILAVAPVALVGALVLTRLLIRPFQELNESRIQLESLYREARQDSLHDGLTGMGNHRAFQDELANQIERSERDGTPFVLLLIDLDNLKVVNDREGHAEGDRLLTGLAKAMRSSLRHGDRFFRIGGDEFAVIMPATEPEAALEAANRLRHLCLRPPTDERATPFSGGISAVPRLALEASQVQRQADTALYWAKRHGRGFVEVFDPDRDSVPDAQGPEGLGNAVYEIARGRMFNPVYQPIVDLRTGAVLGFEGLVRPDPEGPIKEAERLFSAAAATGHTVELDLASFETVVAGAKEIDSDHMISINLSAKTLEVKDFDAGWLLNALMRYGISPARVIVELTERDPVVDVKRLQDNVRHLGEYGLRLAADDVGAGSAGLRMLAEIPFDIVKIDLGLVQSGAQQSASWQVLRSLRDFAWRQKCVVIGEGVETPEQLRALQQLAIPVAQGYLLGRPEPQPDVRPRELVKLAPDPRSGVMAPPRSYEDERDLPPFPDPVPEQPTPRPIPLQLQTLPTSQA